MSTPVPQPGPGRRSTRVLRTCRDRWSHWVRAARAAVSTTGAELARESITPRRHRLGSRWPPMAGSTAAVGLLVLVMVVVEDAQGCCGGEVDEVVSHLGL
jgi:hypothetical protein